MADGGDFAIQVTADVTAAGQAFDQLLGIVQNAASKAGAELARFDAAMSKGSGNLLQMAAAMHPVGRTALALVESLDKAVAVGAKLAETFGAQDQFGAFQASLDELKASFHSTALWRELSSGSTRERALAGGVLLHSAPRRDRGGRQAGQRAARVHVRTGVRGDVRGLMERENQALRPFGAGFRSPEASACSTWRSSTRPI